MLFFSLFAFCNSLVYGLNEIQVTAEPVNFSFDASRTVIVHNPKYFKGVISYNKKEYHFLYDTGVNFYQFSGSGTLSLTLAPEFSNEKTCYLTISYTQNCNYLDVYANINSTFVVNNSTSSYFPINQYTGERCILFVSVDTISYSFKSFGGTYYVYEASSSYQYVSSNTLYQSNSTSLLIKMYFRDTYNLTVTPSGIVNKTEDPNIEYYRGYIMTQKTSKILPFIEQGEHVENIPKEGLELYISSSTWVAFSNPDYFTATGRNFYNKIDSLGDTGKYYCYYEDFGKLQIKPKTSEYSNKPCYFTIFEKPSGTSCSYFNIYSGINAIFSTSTSGRINVTNTNSQCILFASPFERTIHFDMSGFISSMYAKVYDVNSSLIVKLDRSSDIYNLKAKSFMFEYYTYSYQGNGIIKSEHDDPPKTDLVFIDDLIYNEGNLILPNAYIQGGNFVEEIDPSGSVITLYPSSILVVHNPEYFSAVYNNISYFGKDGKSYFNTSYNAKIRIHSSTGKAEKCYFSISIYEGISCTKSEVYDGSDLKFNFTNTFDSNISASSYSTYCFLITSIDTLIYNYEKISSNYQYLSVYLANGSRILNDEYRDSEGTIAEKTYILTIKTHYTYSGSVRFNSSIVEKHEDTDYTFNNGVLSGYQIFLSLYYLRSGDYVEEINSTERLFMIRQYTIVSFHNPSYFDIVVSNSTTYSYKDNIAYINSTEPDSFTVKTKAGKKERIYFSVFRYGGLSCTTFNIYDGSSTMLQYNKFSGSNLTMNSYDQHCIMITSPNVINMPFKVNERYVELKVIDLYQRQLISMTSGSTEINASSVIITLRSTSYISGNIQLDKTKFVESCKDASTYNFIEDVITGYDVLRDPHILHTGELKEKINKDGNTYNIAEKSIVIIHNPSYFIVSCINGTTKLTKYEDDVSMINATTNSFISIKTKGNEPMNCYITAFSYKDLACNTFDVYDGSFTYLTYEHSFLSNTTTDYKIEKCLLITSPNDIKYTKIDSSSYLTITSKDIFLNDFSSSITANSIFVSLNSRYTSPSGSFKVTTAIASKNENTEYKYTEDLLTGYTTFVDPHILSSGDFVQEVGATEKQMRFFEYSLIVFHNPTYVTITTNSTNIIENGNIVIINSTTAGNFSVKSKLETKVNCYFSVFRYNYFACGKFAVYDGSYTNLNVGNRRISNTTIIRGENKCILFTSPNELNYSFRSTSNAAITIYNLEQDVLTKSSTLNVCTKKSIIMKIEAYSYSTVTGEIALSNTVINKECDNPSYNFNEGLLVSSGLERMPYVFVSGDYAEEIPKAGREIYFFNKTYVVLHNPSHFKLKVTSGTIDNSLVFIDSNYGKIKIEPVSGKTETCYFTVHMKGDISCAKYDVYSGSLTRFNVSDNYYDGNTTNKLFNGSCLLLSSPSTLNYTFMFNSKDPFEYYSLDASTISSTQNAMSSFIIRYREDVVNTGYIKVTSEIVTPCENYQNYLFNEDILTSTGIFTRSDALRTDDYCIEVKTNDTLKFSLRKNAFIVIHNPSYFSGTIEDIATGKTTDFLNKSGIISYFFNDKGIVRINVREDYDRSYNCYFTVFEKGSEFSQCSTFDYYTGEYAEFTAGSSNDANASLSSTGQLCILLSSPNVLNYTFTGTETAYVYDLKNVIKGSLSAKSTLEITKKSIIVCVENNNNGTFTLNPTTVVSMNNNPDYKFFNELIKGTSSGFPSYIKGNEYVIDMRDLIPRTFYIHSDTVFVIHNPSYFNTKIGTEAISKAKKHYEFSASTQITFYPLSSVHLLFAAAELDNDCDSLDIIDGTLSMINIKGGSSYSNASLIENFKGCAVLTSVDMLEYKIKKIELSDGIDTSLYSLRNERINNMRYMSQSTIFTWSTKKETDGSIIVERSVTQQSNIRDTYNIEEGYFTTSKSVFYSDSSLREGDYDVEITGENKTITFSIGSTVIFHNPSYFLGTFKSENVLGETGRNVLTCDQKESLTIRTKNNEKVTCYFSVVFNIRHLSCDEIDYYSGSNPLFRINNIDYDSNITIGSISNKYCIVLSSANYLSYKFVHEKSGVNYLLYSASSRLIEKIENETTYNAKTLALTIENIYSSSTDNFTCTVKNVISYCAHNKYKFNEGIQKDGQQLLFSNDGYVPGNYMITIPQRGITLPLRYLTTFIVHNPMQFIINETNGNKLNTSSIECTKKEYSIHISPVDAKDTVLSFVVVSNKIFSGCDTIDIISGNSEFFGIDADGNANVTMQKEMSMCFLLTSTSIKDYNFYVHNTRADSKLQIFEYDGTYISTLNSVKRFSAYKKTVLMRFDTDSIISGIAGIIRSPDKFNEGVIKETKATSFINKSSLILYRGKGEQIKISDEVDFTELENGFHKIIINSQTTQIIKITGKYNYYVFHNPVPFSGTVISPRTGASISCLGRTSITVLKGDIECNLTVEVKSTSYVEKTLYVTVFSIPSGSCSTLDLSIGRSQFFSVDYDGKSNCSSSESSYSPTCIVFASAEQMKYTFKNSYSSYGKVTDLATGKLMYSGNVSRTVLLNITWYYNNYFTLRGDVYDDNDYGDKSSFPSAIIPLASSYLHTDYSNNKVSISSYSEVLSSSSSAFDGSNNESSIFDESFKYQVSVISVLFVIFTAALVYIYIKTKKDLPPPPTDNPEFDEENMYKDEDNPYKNL